MHLSYFGRGVFSLILAAFVAPAGALAQMAMLGQSYPSGAVYLMVPEGEDVSWPDIVALMPLADGASGATGQLDRIARDVHPPAAENAPSAAGRCGRAGEPVAEPGLNVFDPGMPDNCEGDARVGLYRADDSIATGAVLGWTGGFTGSPDLSRAGQPRIMSAEEAAGVAAYRDSFLARYQNAFDTPFDPERSPIGPITTRADARILAEVPVEGGLLRLSEWERISISQHIYRHFIVDVTRAGQVVETFQFIRFQGVLG